MSTSINNPKAGVFDDLHGVRANNMRQLIQQKATATVKETRLLPEMVNKFAEDAEHYGALATRLNAAAYRSTTQHLPFTPAELHTLALCASILRTKGVEISDAIAAGIVRRAVPRTE